MPPEISSPKMRHQASQLRHDQTEEEKRLWKYLRAHQLGNTHFRRQYAISDYIVDFCAPRKKLIIELDGQPHIKSKDRDQEKTAFLASRGYRVLRFWNHEVMRNITEVIKTIEVALKER